MSVPTVAPTNPYSVSLLITELKTDPLSLGYAALISADNIAALSALLNSRSGQGTGPVAGDTLNAVQFRDLIDPTDAGNMLASATTALVFHVGALDVDVGNPKRQAILNTILSQYSATLANVQATYTRTGSRAEVLWGNGTIVSDSDIESAISQGA